jgi:23S rRNA pseudouridine1911/1915/1917 synthase
MSYNFCVLIEKTLRVDMYLSALFSVLSRSYIQKLIDKEQVKINGKSISKNVKIKNKDEVFIEIKNEKLI